MINVSILEINLENKNNDFTFNKVVIIQFLKEKGIMYKNIIANS